MHLAQRAYGLIALAALLGVADLWADPSWLTGLWRWPLGLLLAGLAWEGAQLRRLRLTARLETRQPAHLGRAQPAQFVLSREAPDTAAGHPSAPLPAFLRRLILPLAAASRPWRLEYLPLLPPLCAPLPGSRRVTVAADGGAGDAFRLSPVRLGSAPCPPLPARIQGPLRLAWWTRTLPVPDTLRVTAGLPPAAPASRAGASGLRARPRPGSGAQIHQLRGYQPGDPLSRIDWKATARAGRLISRERSAEPGLDLLVALDAGSSGRQSVGEDGDAPLLERHALHARVAARLAHSAITAGARAGLLLYADAPLAGLAPGAGWPALARMRRALEETPAQPVPSDPVAAGLALRRLLRQPSLVVLLTTPADPGQAQSLARLARVLGPAHRLIVAGCQEPRIAQLASLPAHGPQDPWIALAAQIHLQRAREGERQLRQRGCRVITAPPHALEQAVLAAQAAALSGLSWAGASWTGSSRTGLAGSSQTGPSLSGPRAP